MLKISPALRLTRVSGAFAAVANVWFIILWSRSVAAEPATEAIKSAPVWLLLVGGAANALGLFAYATALNDLLDWRRDRALNPDRPIPSGRLSVDAAVTLVACTLCVAVLGATVLGMSGVLLTLLVAAAVLFFNATGKYIPAVGLVALGLIYAGQMVVPNLALRFVWPVWLVMSHALAVGAVVHVVGRKVPQVSTRAGVCAFAGWAFWSIVILSVGYVRGGGMPASSSGTAGDGAGRSTIGDAAIGAVQRGGAGPPASVPGTVPWPGSTSGTLWPEWVHAWAWVWPVILVVLFGLLCWRRIRSHGSGPRAADKVARYGALWLSLYACGWLVGQRLWDEAMILGALSVAGILGMTVLREVFALVEHPVGYRR